MADLIRMLDYRSRVNKEVNEAFDNRRDILEKIEGYKAKLADVEDAIEGLQDSIVEIDMADAAADKLNDMGFFASIEVFRKLDVWLLFCKFKPGFEFDADGIKAMAKKVNGVTGFDTSMPKGGVTFKINCRW